MKKKHTITFFLLFICLSLNGYCQKSSSIPKGNIKSLVILEEKADMMIKKQFKESETYYDQKGNILEEIEYKQGKVTSHFKYQYDSDNNKIREEEYDPAGKLKEYSEYKFDKGLRVEKIVYDAGKKVRLRKIYNYTLY